MWRAHAARPIQPQGARVGRVKYDLDFQVALLNKYGKQAVLASMSFTHRNSDAILSRAMDRLLVGFEEFGDSGLQWGVDRNWNETIEEICDAVNCRTWRIAMDRGDLPWKP